MTLTEKRGTWEHTARDISATVARPVDEPLAVLLLPGKLEDFELEAHARDLLAIPRVIALEPSRIRTPWFIRDSARARQAARLRFPGAPRVLVLYHPAQYPLARALCARHKEAELWYVRLDPSSPGLENRAVGELGTFDELARQRAKCTLAVLPDAGVQDQTLRLRLHELGVISPYAFVPGQTLRGR